MIARRIRFLLSALSPAAVAAVFSAAVFSAAVFSAAVFSAAVLPPAVPVAAQETPLGQPAGWTVADSVTLIAIASGSELYREPDHAAMVITVLPDARLPLVETRENWVKVRYGDRVGWVDLEADLETDFETDFEARRESGEVPALRFVVTEPEPLAIGEGWQKGELGPYKLFSKVSEPSLIDYLDSVASEHARVYAERYGLEVAPELTGSVLLFAGRQPFLDFQRSRGNGMVENRIDAYFHSPDTVLMYRGRGSRHKLAATLIHELTHLINWQTLRAKSPRRGANGKSPRRGANGKSPRRGANGKSPRRGAYGKSPRRDAHGTAETSMPPWLEEGMAEDLSLSRINRKGRLVAEPLGPTNLHYGRRLGVRLRKLGQEIAIGGTAPSLPRLLAMDKESFLASDVSLNYFMSALWIRYLLSDGEPLLAAGFRAFLASVAGGGRPDPEELRSRLGRDWQQLAGDFRGWLLIQQARAGL